MKKISSVSILFFAVVFCIEAQTKEIEFKETLDTASFRILYKFELLTLKEKNPFTVTDTMSLEVGDTWSKYYSYYRKEKDSITIHNRLNDAYPLLWRRFGGGGEELQKRLESKQEVIDVLDLRKVGEPSIVYKNRRSNEIITIDEGPMEMPSTHTLFRFTENIPPQNWVILDDTLTVLGYLCQKATTVFRGRNYTVCFTMEIPVDDGPWKLYGLPGLILKAEDSDAIFRMEAIGLKKTQKAIDVVWEENWNHRGQHIKVIKKFIGGNMEQWHAYRKQRFREISMSFLVGDHIQYYPTRNPIEYPEIEIVE